MGVFRVKPDGIDRDEFELDLIDHGLEDMGTDKDDDGNERIVVRCAFEDFGQLQSGLEGKGIEPLESGSEWVPNNLVDLDDDKAEEVLKLVDRIEQDDDVQKVFHNLA